MKRYAWVVVSVTFLAACADGLDLEPAPLEGDRTEIAAAPPAFVEVCEESAADVFALVDGLSLEPGDSVEAGVAVSFRTSKESGNQHWVVREVESARMVQEAQTTEFEFIATVPATYEVSLATAEQECSFASEPFVVRVVPASPPPPGVVVELAWYTQGDEDPTDLDSANLDLHYRHESGFWNSDPWDCWRENKAPDWGPAGLPGNPRLTASGFGFRPEVLEHRAPESAFYEIGVHYADDAGFGRSVAVVRVFFNGELRYEDAATLDPGAFWPVGSIHGAVGAVFPPESANNAAIRD